MPLLNNGDIMEVCQEIKLKVTKIELSNKKAKKVLDSLDRLKDGYDPYNLEEL